MPSTPPTSRVMSLTALATERRSAGRPSMMSSVPGVMPIPNPTPKTSTPPPSTHSDGSSPPLRPFATIAKPTPIRKSPREPGILGPNRFASAAELPMPMPTPTGTMSSATAAPSGLYSRTICRYCGVSTKNPSEAKNCTVTMTEPAASPRLRKSRTSSDGTFARSWWTTNAAKPAAPTPSAMSVTSSVQPR